MNNLFPYLKKDILWAGGFVLLSLLIGSPFLSIPWINHLIFILFSILIWRNIKISKNLSVLMTLGRISALASFFGLSISLIMSGFIVTGFIDFRHLLFSVSLGTFVYEYYIFSIWKTEIDFSKQKNLIFIGISLIIFLELIGRSIINSLSQ